METRPSTLVPAPPSGRNLRMVSREWLLRSVGESVERTLLEFSALGPAARHTLRDQIVQRFVGLTQERARRVRGLTRAEVLQEFERTHAELLASRERARSELSQLESRLSEARLSPVSSELDAAQEADLARALEIDLVRLLRAEDPRALLKSVIEREGQRRARALSTALEQALGPERERAEVLERRVAKLRGELERMERSLVELERRSAVDTGVASIYKEVQGLDEHEQALEAKRGLLRSIFEANLELQRHHASLELPAT